MQRDGEVRPDTVGKVAEGVEVGISAQREILVRSPGLFKGYHRDPETTRRRPSTTKAGSTPATPAILGDDGHLRIIDRLVNVGTLSDGTLHAPRVIENKLKFYPYIREAVAFGHGRDRVCVLIDIDFAAVGRWADKRDISYTGHADLAARDEVRELVAECVGKVNADLALEQEWRARRSTAEGVLPRAVVGTPREFSQHENVPAPQALALIPFFARPRARRAETVAAPRQSIDACLAFARRSGSRIGV